MAASTSFKPWPRSFVQNKGTNLKRLVHTTILKSCFSAFKVGIDPLLTSTATTLPSTTCESKTAVKVSTSRSSTPFTSKVANKASKAALVGANTVKGPSALSGVIELLQQRQRRPSLE